MAKRSNGTSTLVAIEENLSIYGPFVLSTMGIIGNVISILIFLSPRYRRQSSHFYLLSLALSDLCFLIINLVEDTLRNHNQLYQSRLNFLDRSSPILCILVEYARNVTRSLSSWIIVSFTIERLLVVFHPLKRAIICRRKIARLVVFVLFLINLLTNINVPFHYGITDASNSMINDTICDILPKYRPIYMRFAISTMISVYLVPMCIIGFVNMLICCKLWRKSLLIDKDEEDRSPRERCVQCRVFRFIFNSLESLFLEIGSVEFAIHSIRRMSSPAFVSRLVHHLHRSYQNNCIRLAPHLSVNIRQFYRCQTMTSTSHRFVIASRSPECQLCLWLDSSARDSSGVSEVQSVLAELLRLFDISLDQWAAK